MSFHYAARVSQLEEWHLVFAAKGDEGVGLKSQVCEGSACRQDIVGLQYDGRIRTIEIPDEAVCFRAEDLHSCRDVD